MDDSTLDLAADEFDAGPFDELPDGGRRQLVIASRDVTVVRFGTRVVALRNQCPHANARLGDGVIKGYEIECPIHHWKFDLRSGATKRDRRMLAEMYPARVLHGRILVRIPGQVASRREEGSCDTRKPCG